MSESLNIIVTALWLGFDDAFNLCALITIGILMIYVFLIGKNVKSVSLCGLFFVLSVFITHLLLIIGFFDKQMESLSVLMRMKDVFVVICGILIIWGLLFVLEWLQFRFFKREMTFLKLPYFDNNYSSEQDLFNQKKGSKNNFLRILLLTIIPFLVGSHLTKLGSVYPHNYLLFVQYMDLLKKQEWFLAITNLFAYNLVFVLPLFLIWQVLVYVKKSKHRKFFSSQRIYLFKMIISAFLLSTGIGGLIIFL